MNVYIDDSGDSGFKFDSGSTSHLVMAACIFRDPKDIEQLANCVEGCAEKNRVATEFKYSKTKDTIKRCFFSCVSETKFSVRTIIIEKSKVHSPTLLENPSKLKSYAIRQLLSHSFGQITDAKIFIDGQDTKAFGMEDSKYFMRKVNEYCPGTLREISFADSKQNVLIQLADMVAGAVNHAERTHKPSSAANLNLFKPRTYQPAGSYWRFK
ncbi:DUF3800 domain-containing protein [Cryobacterium glucosi]|uniref:DUF3800 domain-containing protein n=1 Tax=Cryobacterium glucosi TaxID=1259175 RepID=A0ABY2IRP9_9MICO|nr:DUF3800 domain-containing protein [Cryobacterium glucosi]TFC23378.1 DUF3800 domain-containing protein [Cryobacterium glucosi]